MEINWDKVHQLSNSNAKKAPKKSSTSSGVNWDKVHELSTYKPKNTKLSTSTPSSASSYAERIAKEMVNSSAARSEQIAATPQKTLTERNEELTDNRSKARRKYLLLLASGADYNTVAQAKKEYDAAAADPLTDALKEERKARRTVTQLSTQHKAPESVKAEAQKALEEAGQKVTALGGTANANAVTGAVQSYAGGMVGAFGNMARNQGYNELIRQADELALRGDTKNAALLREEAEKVRQTGLEGVDALGNALTEKGSAQIETAKYGRSKAGQILTDVGVQAVQMGLDVAGGVLTGGGSLVPMAARSYGSASQQAMMETGDRDRAELYGVANAAVEVFSEMLFDGLAGAYGKGTADDVVDYVVGKLASTPQGQAAWSMVFSFGGEAAEEVISGVMDPVISSIYNGKSIKQNLSEVEIGDIAYDAFIGGLMGGLGGAVELATSDGTKSAFRLAGEQNLGFKGANAAVNTFGGMSEGQDTLDLYRDYGRYLATDARLKSSEGSRAQQLASEMAGQYKLLTEKQTGQLMSAVKDDRAEVRTRTVTEAARQRLTEMGESNADTLSKIIGKKISGQQITPNEALILEVSNNAATVENELKGMKVEQKNPYVAEKKTVNTQPVVNYNAKARQIVDDPELLKAFEENYKTTVKGTKSEQHKAVAEILQKQDTSAFRDGVTVTGVADIKNGTVTVKLSNGDVAAVGDIAFDNDAIGELYNGLGAAKFKIPTVEAAVAAYDGTMDAPEYVTAWQEAYRYGQLGIPKSKIDSNGFAARLNDAQFKAAWEQGRLFTDEKVTEAKSAVKAVKSGEGSFINDTGSDLDARELNEMQRSGITLAETLAKVVGNDVHVYESVVQNGRRVLANDMAGFKKGQLAPNGFFVSTNGDIYIDIAAGQNGEGTMAYTLGHEYSHFIKAFSPEEFQKLADFLVTQFGNGKTVDELVLAQAKKLGYDTTKPLTDEQYEAAFEEFVGDSMETIFTDTNALEKLTALKETSTTLWEKLKEMVQKFFKAIKTAYENAIPGSAEANTLRQLNADMEKLSDLFAEGLYAASEAYQNVAGEGTPVIADPAQTETAKATDGDVLYQYRAFEADEDEYRSMLLTHGMEVDKVNNLFSMLDDVVEKIKSNLSALDYAWEKDIDDRAFAPVKPNSDPLYKFSVDFSTLCRKRILQQTVINQLQDMLNSPISREDAIKVRDELMKVQAEGRKIEVACALCYVESARMKSHAQIKKFLQSPVTLLTDFFAGKDAGETKQRVAAAEKAARQRLGVDDKAALKSLPKSIADQIRAAKKEARLDYTPTAEEQKLIEAVKKMRVTDFTTPEGLENLAKNYPRIFDAYTSYIRNATKSKGIENDTWWRAGDSKAIGNTIMENMNAENGLRSQSWSDFQVIHLLDYIASTIELSSRDAKLQVYTKVADYVRLMGKTGAMINLSLIPAAKWSGALEYDSTEGIDYQTALALRQKYPDTVGTICIGIKDEQIRMMMADLNIDYIIPYHKSGMSKAIRNLMHIPLWSEYETYQVEGKLSEAEARGEGVELDMEHWHQTPEFSDWFDLAKARETAERENANPSRPEAAKLYGNMYGAYMAMQEAANKYFDVCAERGLTPKFQQFTQEDNYWKLLIDRKMVNQVTGEIIEQRALTPTFDREEVMGILNDELARYETVKADQDYAIRTVTERFMSGKVDGLSADTQKAIERAANSVAKMNILANAEEVGDVEFGSEDTAPEVKQSSRTVPTSDNNAVWGFDRHSLYSVSAGELNAMGNWAGLFQGDMKTKSPFFRAWFGEWRENSTYSVFNKRKTIPLRSGITMEKVYEDRKSGTSKFSGSSKGTNIDTGMEIEYGKLLVKDTMSKTLLPPDFDEATASALYYIDDIIRDAVLLDTEISDPGKANKSVTTVYMHKFYLPINMRDSNGLVTRYIAKLSVEQFVQANSPKQRAYNLQAIEMLPLSRSPSPGKNPGTGQVGLNSSVESIADLINAVKQIDPDYAPKSPSKVVDSDGNPMVMYHGTNQGGFSEFNPGSARDGTSLFFTNSYDVAKTYTSDGDSGAQIYPVYLNLQNPLMIDVEGEFGVDWTSVPFQGSRKSTYDIADYAKKNGYDGVLIKGLADIGGRSEYGYNPEYTTDGHDYTAVVFDPENIKSADDNKGTYSPYSRNIYQSSRTPGLDNRTLLTNHEAQNDTEQRMLDKYIDTLSQMDALTETITGQKETLKELLASDIKDKTVVRAQREAITANENRLGILQNQAARQEEGATLTRIIEQERAKAMGVAYERGRFDQGYENRTYEERLRAKDREVAAERQKAAQDLQIQRQNALQKQQEIREAYRNRMSQGVENRQKRDLRLKIQRKVTDLNNLLLRGTQDKHILIGLQKSVAEALDIINMDTVSAEARLSELDARIAKETKQSEIERLLAYRERIVKADAKLGDKLSSLRTAYADIINSTDPIIANSHDDVIAQAIEETANLVGDTPLRDMSVEQLEAVNRMYTMVKHSISNANKVFKAQKAATIEQLGTSVINEMRGDKNWLARLKLTRKNGSDPASIIRKFIWNDAKPIYAFKALGSQTLTERFNVIRAGEDTWYRDISEAKAKALEIRRKYNRKSWNFDQTWTFKSTSGMEFSLNLDQILSLYAYSRRPAAADHIAKGGIVLEGGEDATSYNISTETLMDITNKLTLEQKAYAREMQDYLSKVMGAKGNEVSLELYGVKLYGEDAYFPLRSASQYMAKAKDNVKGEVKIKNSGFSKATTPNANNPIILDGFDAVWADHVNDMSMYHAFVLPMEDFYRVFNYKTGVSEDTAIESVNAAIENRYGKEAVAYIDQLLKDLNGGARSDPNAGLVNTGLSLFKKGATFASLSVVIQQPSAVGRAYAYIDPKYFVGKVGIKDHAAKWEELKKYAPVAGIKEMGAFDTDMGRSTQDYINAEEYETAAEKLKGVVTDRGYRDDLIGRAPELADEITWVSIWEAAKRKAAAETNLHGEDLLNKAGEIFTECIVNTQVYDSVLSRSGLMRSKDTGVKMATAFMAEPTTAVNMLMDAVINKSRGNSQMAAREIGAGAAAITLNAILQSVIYAMRDDDDDESYAEKYTASLVDNLKSGFNPLNMTPFFRDLVSIANGYDVERSDISVIADLFDASRSLSRDDISTYRKVEDFGGSIAKLLGLPVKNVMRDIRGIYNTATNTMKNESTKAGFRYALLEGLTGDSTSDAQQLYLAMLDGDQTQIDRVRQRYDTENEAHSAIRKALRDNDPRIGQAAEARYDGNTAEYIRIAREILAEGIFDQTDIVEAIEAETDKIRKERDTDEAREYVAKQESIGDTTDFISALTTGDYGSAKAVREDMIASSVANGKSKMEAESAFKSAASGAMKSAYFDGSLSESTARSALKSYLGYSTDEANDKLRDWKFEKSHGWAYADRGTEYKAGRITRSELVTAMVSRGVSREDAETQATVYDWQKEGYDVTSSAVEKYAEKGLAGAGVGKADFYQAWRLYNDTPGEDKNGDGKTDSYSKARNVMAAWARELNLSEDQLNALASAWWADKTVRRYKAW